VSRYRKVDPRIWNDEKFRRLSDQAKLLFFFLLTHPHMTALGAMRASIPGLAAELQWNLRAFAKGFREVLSKGLAKHDVEASFLWIPNFLKYNPPESPNVVKSWSLSADLLPECSLKEQLLQAVKDLTEGLGEAFGEALPKAFAKAMPNQEQEQEPEQEQEEEKRARAAADKNGSLSVEDLFSLYNELTPRECPKATVLSVARREKARKYLKMFPTENFWREAFAQVHRSKFLRGLKNGTDQHCVFDSDWMLTKGKDGSENIVKVHDGKYV